MDKKIKIEIYVANNGKAPFISWLESLKDKTVRYRIKERLDRVVLDNLGDYKLIAKGLAELRFNFGSGYRVYFGQHKEEIILLLCGGDKSTQEQDIKKAKEYWKNYLSGVNDD
jgi:putative addiction module killer protein